MRRYLVSIAVVLMCASTPAKGQNTQEVDLVDDIKKLDQKLQQIIEDIAGPEATAAHEARRLLEQSANAIPEADVEIFATATDGTWSISYWVGEKIEVTGNIIALPIGKVAKLNATSSDIIYEMTFPDLELEFDAIPGCLASVSIRPEKPAVLTGTCKDLCGTRTAPLVLHFMTPEDYAAWRKVNELPAE